MSHFIVAVLVNRNEIKDLSHKGVESAVATLLAPYDENIETEPRRVYLSPEDELNMLKQYKLDPMAADLNAQLVEKMADWHGSKGYLDESQRVYYMTTYNEQSKWDWWSIGGRWTGWLSGYDPTTDHDNWEMCSMCGGTGKRTDALGREERAKNPEYGCNGCGEWDEEKKVIATGTGKSLRFTLKQYDGDVMPVRAIPADKTPFAIVTPDGVWHEKGNMGWWACVSDEKAAEDWKEEVTSLFAQHQDTICVAVDCHI